MRSHPHGPNRARTILLAWLLVGTIDLLCAILVFRLQQPARSWTIVPRFIASAAFGPRAFTADGMVATGIGLHYFIALLFTLFFFLVHRWLRRWHPILLGLAYGAFAWSVMNLVIVPNSLARPRPLTLEQSAIQMGILVLAIGLPLVFIARSQTRR